eukprot:Phypoly_transcript_03186.p1 GENE.Phypoly_transcript_03186~~Phypoly_transcript_03186.p1  ORF type:complete len:799 (+),score=113.91 Phypoly_transcript_03186:67-2463(+)
MKGIIWEILLIALFAQYCVGGDVSVSVTSSGIVLQNSFVKIRFNTQNPQIDVLQADSTGQGKYGPNLVASNPDKLYRQGIVLERDTMLQNTFTQYASSVGPCQKMSYTIPVNTPQIATVVITDVCDAPTDYVFVSNWTITLAANSQTFDLSISAYPIETAPLLAARVSVYASTPSVYGLFNSRGMRQMMNSPDNYFASMDSLYYFYTLGLAPELKGVYGGCIDFNASGYTQLVLLSGDGKSVNYNSGIQLVMTGYYPVVDMWNNSGWAKATPTNVQQGTIFQVNLWNVGLNDQDFPAGRVTNFNGLPAEHTQAIYTAIYASTIGAIPSYLFPGAFAPTLATPIIAYTGLYTFYDPDSFFAISSLSYSGDEYLFNQAKQAIELSERWMLPTGQIPHHFIDNATTPTYIAISGATQTGPNIFWTLSALRIARMSGDYAWLEQRMPALEQSLSFLLSMYNKTEGLLSVPGSLYIDVFIRANFTSDSNIAMVYLLTEIAEAETFFGNSALAATRLALAESISNRINELLWSSQNDHYITNLSPDGTFRDFVDYDANTLAVAWGVSPPNRTAAILKRVDSGKCTHARATYVSEVYYSAPNCFLNNTGDSAVTMGRIGWGDGIARYRVGDYNTFYDLILNPLLGDLFKNTWLYERFTCEATPTHNNYYHEYPETILMLLREVVYGIYIGLTSIHIAPFPEPPATASSYTYNVGNVNISYSQKSVSINVPGNSVKNITIESLLPNTKYEIQEIATFPIWKRNSQQFEISDLDFAAPSYAVSDSAGNLNFEAATGSNVTVTIQVAS